MRKEQQVLGELSYLSMGDALGSRRGANGSAVNGSIVRAAETGIKWDEVTRPDIS